MKEGISTHFGLLGVEIYNISNKYIYNLREGQKKERRVFEHLPDYTLNKNEGGNNSPILAEYYHQFVGSFEDEKNEEYLYFDLTTSDQLIQMELTEGGVETILSDFDFEKLLSPFTPFTQEDIIKLSVPEINYLVVKITYITSYGDGVYDCEIDFEIVGYLDNNLIRQEYGKD